MPSGGGEVPRQAFPRVLAQQRPGKVLQRGAGGLEVGLEKAEEVCAWEVSVGFRVASDPRLKRREEMWGRGWGMGTPQRTMSLSASGTLALTELDPGT